MSDQQTDSEASDKPKDSIDQAEVFYDKKSEEKPEEEEKAEEKSEDVKSDEDSKAGADGESEEKKAESDKDESKEGEEKSDGKFDFSTDEDSPLSDDHLDEIALYSKEQGLTNDQAQKVVDMQEGALKGLLKSQQDLLVSESAAWFEANKKDSEVGGEAFGENAELAKRVLGKFGSSELSEILNDTGYGNHPELFKTFVRIGKAMAEDKLVLPGAQSSKPKKSYEDVFYGDSTSKS